MLKKTVLSIMQRKISQKRNKTVKKDLNQGGYNGESSEMVVWVLPTKFCFPQKP